MNTDAYEVDLEAIGILIRQIKPIAIKYYELTGKPLGITSEIGEYEASRLLNLRLQPARQVGYDAIREEAGVVQKIQIKTRRMMSNTGSQRIGSLKSSEDWDVVLFVHLDTNLEPLRIYEAVRPDVLRALEKTRADGQMSVSMFKRISRVVWRRELH